MNSAMQFFRELHIAVLKENDRQEQPRLVTFFV